MRRSYENALKLLATRRRKARPTTPALSRTLQDAGIPNDNQTVRGIPSLVGMKEWLQILGHSESDVNNLNIVHISGTKGKGSTCAFTRSFLHAHGIRTGFPKRIGLYTSPDLQCIRERIQIDNQPITEDLFTQYFFEVWDSLASRGLGQDVETTRQPRYLQFLALLAFHAFIRENVDVAIFETHHGGEYDATNVIPRPVVTGITSLGMDHIEQLGPTIENIAWHKAGILKPGAPAFSVPQEAGPMKVLGDRAAEKKTSLTFISTDNHLPANVRVLSAPVQRLNASLAIELARMFLQLKAPGHTMDSDDIARGIDNFSWLGRFETIEDGMSQWFLDGAHNPLSLKQAAEWFSNNIDAQNPRRRRVLIFSHFSEVRDGVALMEYKTIKEPETPFPDLCATYVSLWKDFDNQAVVASEPTIEAALNLAKRISAQEGGMQVFVTGSLHLVGGALNLLRP
ncbi:folylpolyglutamate synthase [Penicillium sp. CMV-2018d]|nr:folylpolyglutamate synthase [Penicillium sp. CMV-2018d]